MIAGLKAVVIDLIEINLAREVVGSDESLFDVPREITTVEEAEVTEAEEEDKAVRIVRGIFGFVAGQCGIVRVNRKVGLCRNESLVGSEDLYRQGCGARELLEREGIAGRENDALFDFGVAIGAGRECPAGLVAALVWNLFREALVVEAADRHEFSEFGKAAKVIDVEVGDNDVVDALQARFISRVEDAFGVATTGVASVDENGFAHRSHYESGATAFGVNPVDLQGGSLID